MARAAIVTISDSRSAGERTDATTAALRALLQGADIEVAQTRLVPDEHGDIVAVLRDLAGGVELVLTTGGTGLAPRDVTPEATLAVVDRLAPGLAEMMRARTAASTSKAYLSRAVAGQRDGCLIVNLPGSPRGAAECLEVLLELLPHALAVGRGGGEGGHAHSA